MKKLLDCFDYIKRYEVHITHSLFILIECFLLKKHNQIKPLLELARKRKKIHAPFSQALAEIFPDFIPPNLNLNLPKILKVVDETPISLLSDFLDHITQKQTNHQLYFHSTPLELSTLLIALLEIQEGESIYNPCFGIGSLFLKLPQTSPIYGEELDEQSSKIAKILCQLSGHSEVHLHCNDILQDSSFRTQEGFEQFDKIICNPPLNTHIGTQYIRDDARFGGIFSKLYPELIFLSHSLVHLKRKGVFLLRTSIFKNQSLEQKLKTALQNKIECIIELPKNLFPFQTHDFCILILTHNAQEIFHIDASSFYLKSGRYNKLTHLDTILSLYQSKSTSPHSKKLKDLDSLFATTPTHSPSLQLHQIASISRGQRVYGGKKDSKIEFFEIGVNDFAPLGFTEHSSHRRQQGDVQKIQQYALKPYDILITLRSNTPKLTILPPTLPHTYIANVGIIVLSATDSLHAQALFMYLLSHQAQNTLQEITDLPSIANLPIPQDFLRYASKFGEFLTLAQEQKDFEQKLQEFKTSLQ
ncbi:hypothetical protein BBW65_03455 [Helicobacter enhydrae]|uniref:site-specific DNA-methyltransferase (adenine-specific) n=1 Tax=Helicobacter enhydrae TaxID=222136 RepID=A0A1B1U5D9_9HELI|nr:N-6 DNA methylase [Helicobacter enhydrae]ANV97912.1 hypothetical protein BBW65_03455 [Helicobacter enhydrae]